MSNENKVDAEVQKLIDTALEVQARFKKTPKLVVDNYNGDKMLELRKTYLPESIGKNATKHEFFGLYKDIGSLANKGYTPVLNESNQLIRFGNENEMVMMSRTIEIHKAQEQADREVNNDIMKNIKERFKSDNKITTGVNNAPKPDRSGIDIEEMEIKSGELV